MLAAIALLAIVTLGYIGLCSAQPFGPCRRCKGFGYHVHQTRTGRRLFNAWQRAKADNAR